jgi:hypothetical protein
MSFESVKLYDTSVREVPIDDPYNPGESVVVPVRATFTTSTGEKYLAERPEHLSTTLMPGQYWIGDPSVFLDEEGHPEGWDALCALGFFSQDNYTVSVHKPGQEPAEGVLGHVYGTDDGVYPVEGVTDAHVVVDSGMVGVFSNPENFTPTSLEELNTLGVFVSVPEESEIVAQDDTLGTGVFIKPRQGDRPTIGVWTPGEE